MSDLSRRQSLSDLRASSSSSTASGQLQPSAFQPVMPSSRSQSTEGRSYPEGGDTSSTLLPAQINPQMLWVSLCLLRSQFRRNTFLHWLHSYGLWSVCVKRWVLRFDLWLKLLRQIGHLCGDSSMCRILCTARVLDWQKPLPHSTHLKGFSFEWMYR